MALFGLSSLASIAPPLLRLSKWRQESSRNGKVPGLGVVCSDERFGDTERINIKLNKMDGNTNRAARKAVMTVLEVDRARLLNADTIKRKHARLLPRALLEALTDRIRSLQWESALKIFALLRLQEWYEARDEMYVKVLAMLAKCRQPDKASKLFEIMVEEDKLIPSREAVTALLSSYMKGGRLNTGFQLFARMKNLRSYQPDVYVYSLMIKACCAGGLFDQARILLEEMQESGIEPNIVTYNTLIDAFGRVSMLSQMEELIRYMLKDGKCKPDTWTWNIIIKHYGYRGEINKMEEWFDILQAAGVRPDRVTLNTLVCAYGRKGLYAKMRSVVTYMHKYLYGVDEYTFNTSLEAYGRGGMIEDMNRTFLVMKRVGIKFNAFTLCCLISAYSKQGMWDEVEKLRRQWKNSDLRPDVPLYNSLIDAYRKSGNVDEMIATYTEMKIEGFQPDEITYTILIDGCERKQLMDKADELLAKMKSLQQVSRYESPRISVD